MESVKERLHRVIDGLTEEQAQRILDLTENLKDEVKQEDVDELLEWLAKNPNIKVPSKGIRDFKKVIPIKGKGIPASKLLIEDRR